jgi:hypothetical protein
MGSTVCYPSFLRKFDECPMYRCLFNSFATFVCCCVLQICFCQANYVCQGHATNISLSGREKDRKPTLDSVTMTKIFSQVDGGPGEEKDSEVHVFNSFFMSHFRSSPPLRKPLPQFLFSFLRPIDPTKHPYSDFRPPATTFTCTQFVNVLFTDTNKLLV